MPTMSDGQSSSSSLRDGIVVEGRRDAVAAVVNGLKRRKGMDGKEETKRKELFVDVVARRKPKAKAAERDSRRQQQHGSSTLFSSGDDGGDGENKGSAVRYFRPGPSSRGRAV